MKALAALLLVPSLALAGNKPPPTAAVKASAEATSASHSVAEASQGQTQSASADNAGNQQIVNASDYTPRQAPSVAQGSLAIVGCGAGVNGGGSNTHGSAFLGFAWTPADCMALQLAQAYQALGHDKAACQVLNSTKAARRAQRRGLEIPACADPVPLTATPVAPVDLSNYPTRDEVVERDNRVFQSASQK